MRRALTWLALGLVLALAIASALAAAPAPPVPGVVHAAAVNLNLNYSDPASDVFQMWTSNGSHVTDASGYWVMSPSPKEVNLIRLGSTDAGTSVDLYLKVQTLIASRPNVTYDISMYSRADNQTHYIFEYSFGRAILTQNRTNAAQVNMTANVTVAGSAFTVTVAEALLGGTTNITAWNLDATSKEFAGNYTYEDFVWQQPGNPGSAPAFIQGRVTDAANGTGLSNVNVSTGTGGYFTTTNATGYYSLPAAPGTFNLTFSLSGYDSATKAVTVQYQQTQTVNAQLSKTSALGASLVWIVAAVIVVAAVALVAVLVRRRRRKPAQPK